MVAVCIGAHKRSCACVLRCGAVAAFWFSLRPSVFLESFALHLSAVSPTRPDPTLNRAPCPHAPGPRPALPRPPRPLRRAGPVWVARSSATATWTAFCCASPLPATTSSSRRQAGAAGSDAPWSCGVAPCLGGDSSSRCKHSWSCSSTNLATARRGSSWAAEPGGAHKAWQPVTGPTLRHSPPPFHRWLSAG